MRIKIKSLFGMGPLLLILFALAGCTDDNSTEANKRNGNTNNQDKATFSEAVADKTLAIAEYKCTGCGKCVRIDPEHFVFDGSSRKAAVISLKNLNSQNLTMAISICRDQAIELS